MDPESQFPVTPVRFRVRPLLLLSWTATLLFCRCRASGVVVEPHGSEFALQSRVFGIGTPACVGSLADHQHRERRYVVSMGEDAVLRSAKSLQIVAQAGGKVFNRSSHQRRLAITSSNRLRSFKNKQQNKKEPMA